MINGQIYFHKVKKDDEQKCHLKELMILLKALKLKSPYNFAYTPPMGELIPNLTLQENILIESPLHQRVTGRSRSLTELLQGVDNPHISALSELIVYPNLLPTRSDLTTIKLASVVKALLSGKELILLDGPEVNLDNAIIERIKMALIYAHNATGQSHLICSSDELTWSPFVHKMIVVDNGQVRLENGQLELVNNKFFNYQPPKQIPSGSGDKKEKSNHYLTIVKEKDVA